MKKRILSFFLAFCVTLGMIPAALAEDVSSDKESAAAKMEISAKERTETGLKFQVSLTGFASGDSLLAVVLQDSGKMKTAFPVGLENGSASLSLDDVADSDTVKVIWTDAAQSVRTYKQTSRPEAAAEFGGEEAGATAFQSGVLNLIARPQFMSAAAEKELEETEKLAETDAYAYKRLIVSAEGKLPDLSAYGKPTVYTNAASGYSILQFSTEEDAKQCEAYLSSLPAVQYVEPDTLFKGGPKDSEGFLGANDADFKSWGVTKINAHKLAAYLKGQSGLSPVVVAVADTGVEADHPFLVGRLTKGFDFIDNDDTPNDQHSHGTHVSGTIVDCTQGLDIRIMPVRVLGASGGGTAIGIAMGIQYAADNGANVINLSLGGGHSNYLDDAILYAVSKGVTVVVAAGNESDNVMNHCPAHVEQAITVGALDTDGKTKASFSNYGTAVDVAAPGVGINSSVLNKQYAQKSGTSMATPHVAAAAAMLKYGNPDMTPEEIQQALKDTAMDLGNPGWDGEYGYGLINLEPFAKPATKYSLTYQTTEGGDVTGLASAAAGEKVSLQVSAKDGYALESLAVTGASGTGVRTEKVGDAAYAFAMPAEDVIVTASFTSEPTGTYKIYYKASEGGEVSGPDTAAPNEEISITAVAYAGYALKDLLADGKSLMGASLSAASASDGETVTFAFAMPDHDVTIEAVFEKSDGPEPITDHTYELFETGLVWDEAKAYCESLGGHLMTVTSADEQKILDNLLTKEAGKGYYWLGGYKSSDGNYAWVTGESFSYTNWNGGEPNNVSGEETVIMAYGGASGYPIGSWNDATTDGHFTSEVSGFGFICEWDGEKPEQPPVEPPATEGIFAVLYQDGELVFQNDNKARQDKPVLETYPVDGQTVKEGALEIKDDDGDVTQEFGVAYAEWYDHADIITKVAILDKIQPTSTALWFHGCKNLTAITGLEKLDTSNVTNMSHMFSQCALLPEPNLLGFDTSKVTDMSHMFYGCKNFKNLDLTSFDTSAVTDMGAMFSGCSALHRVYASDKFVTDAVTNSTKMFAKCEAIEGTYGTKFDKAHTDKEYARLDDPHSPPTAPGYFTDSLAIDGKAHVYLYADGEMVFQLREGADAARTLIKGYELDVVKRDDYEVNYAKWYDERAAVKVVTFADPIRPYATSQWFYGCLNLTEFRNMENLNTRAVTDMSYMFSGCSALASLDLSGLDTRNVTSMRGMFENCASLSKLDVSGFDTAKVTNMDSMFKGCSGLTSLDLNSFNVSNVTDMSNMFRDCVALTALNVSSFSTDSLTDMNYMFRGCAGLESLDVSNFNTSKVTDMKYLFSGCASLASLDLSAFDTGKVTDMRHMFEGCASLRTLDASERFNTANVTNMSAMFADCASLSYWKLWLDSGLDTANVTDMSDMFSGCASLADVGHLNTASVTDMSGMFAGCASLSTVYLEGFNTANVTDMSGMFQGSGMVELNLARQAEDGTWESGWNTGKVTNMEDMFRDCSALATVNVIPGVFSTGAVTNSANMFTGCANLVGGRGTAYSAAHVDKEYARIDFGEREPGYFTDPSRLVLTFDPNDTAEDPATGFMEEQLFTRGVAETLTPNAFSREGYDFTGWNTKPDGSGKAYKDGDSIALTEDLTLYAQWEYAFMEKLYAILYSDGELVFQWNDKAESGRSVVKTYVTDRRGYSDNREEQNNFRAWYNEAARITTVTFAKRIQPDDTAQWFQNCRNLAEIRNPEKLDTSLVTDMSNMFAGCASLTELNLTSFDTANVKSMEFMFEDCASLKTLDLSSFDTANVSLMAAMFSGCEKLTTIYASGKFAAGALKDEGEDMFMDCWNLAGGSGTAFDEDCADASYARIDGGESSPGYFTAA